MEVAGCIESCSRSLKLPKKPKVSEKLPGNLWTEITRAVHQRPIFGYQF